MRQTQLRKLKRKQEDRGGDEAPGEPGSLTSDPLSSPISSGPNENLFWSKDEHVMTSPWSDGSRGGLGCDKRCSARREGWDEVEGQEGSSLGAVL